MERTFTFGKQKQNLWISVFAQIYLPFWTITFFILPSRKIKHKQIYCNHLCYLGGEADEVA